MNCLLYECESKITEEDQKQVGTVLKFTESRKISVSRDLYRRFQHRYITLTYSEEEVVNDHARDIHEGRALKLEPDDSLFGNL